MVSIGCCVRCEATLFAAAGALFVVTLPIEFPLLGEAFPFTNRQFFNNFTKARNSGPFPFLGMVWMRFNQNDRSVAEGSAIRRTLCQRLVAREFSYAPVGSTDRRNTFNLRG